MTSPLIKALLGCMLSMPATAFASQLTVLELFTSQGCSSCPPADALLVELAADPVLLVLSYHVDYWDRLGWPDRFSLQESTARQYRYAQWMGRNNVFTPQLVVDGQASMNGADRSSVARTLASARSTAKPIAMQLRHANGNPSLHVPAAPTQGQATLIAVSYVPLATTNVTGGENNGRALQSVNNVTAIHALGAWQTTAQEYRPTVAAGEGLAVLLQDNSTGEILAASNLPPAHAQEAMAR